ncbi:ABC transporter permease [Crocosphaera sp. UHCC 0190]|uniref:ABC transporter permease n=1 Tax=Crocosphaera sp. UHCC 0190 TaxID=3110246 RepID=UPI002B1F0C91|nr:ABC transporter permease [Crocosphaera sp. UHCC 0190]MEA5510718.1 ABC transporter permease [Crocosphaera sp. UHCC 0190]
MNQTPLPQLNKPLNRLQNLFDSETIFYIIKRVLQGLLTILLASFLSFIIIQIAPGDYLDTLKQNPKIAKETIEQLTIRFGLDQPWYVQYWRWLIQVVTRLDFGESFVYNRSVSSLLAERIPATLLLAISSIIITWLIAIPLGILSAVKQGSWTDRILRVISYFGQGFPSFITALVLLILAQYLSPLFPVGDMTSLNHAELSPLGKLLDIGWHMILPTIALSITSFAGLMRLMRGQMLDVMGQDYIQTARAKGLPEDQVIYVHALRNAINPLITLLGFEFASLLGGAFIAEFFFNWPGLGRLILQAVTAQDLYLVMGSLTMGATMLIVGNLLADLLLKAVDPRIKLENLK